MNRLPAIVSGVTACDGIALIDVRVGELGCTAMLVGEPTPADRYPVGRLVTLAFKELEVSLAKRLSGEISLRNRLPCRVTALHQGALLTRVDLLFGHYPLSALITSRSAQQLTLAPGDEVEALIKANEMTLLVEDTPNGADHVR
ncbi:TOBE domain-containing protein [Crenobacter sp. SG2305]|uniref:TOBE domain-containing protein n=1 Tax=Crenobacter oryzisoli TaxID=3056844 RepID=UPI0025AB5A71|nr:TOBE domain-containing protein [Crenobacter sp. SG2305]MDN0084923.1 TOBE domain-containing protein [Crenobacter sp. SG2305]